MQPPQQYGQPPQQYGQPQQQYGQYQSQNMYDTPQVRALLKNNPDYYIRVFNELETQNKKASWNWCAFLFTWIWMIYRGIFTPLFWVVLILTATIGYINIYAALCINIYVGITANNHYKEIIDRKLRGY